MNGPDAQRARLRELVATIDRELSQQPRPSTTEGHDMIVSWSELVALLALGPPPEVRNCPGCGSVIMRGASRCGYCWAQSSAPAAGG